MTDRIKDFLARTRGRRAAPGRRPRSRARQLFRLRQGAARHARLLRGQGQPGAGDPRSARPARLVLRRRFGRRDRADARRRRERPTASATATRSRRSATSRAPTRSACACSPSTAKRKSTRSPAPRRARRCSAASCATAPAPNGRCRASSAARRSWRRGARARPSARPRRPRPVVPRRLAAAQPARLGRGAEGLGDDLQGARRARHPAVDAQPRRRLPDPLPQADAQRADVWPDDLPRPAQAFRQPHPGDDHRAGPRHGRQRRNHRGGSGADLAQVGRTIRAAGSISTSASSTASPRRWTR